MLNKDVEKYNKFYYSTNSKFVMVILKTKTQTNNLYQFNS